MRFGLDCSAVAQAACSIAQVRPPKSEQQLERPGDAVVFP